MTRTPVWSQATLPAPGTVNQDLVRTGETWALVLDGATPAPGVPSGCEHDVPWLVATLARHLSRRLPSDLPLPLVLHMAITATMRAHQPTCDLTNPNSPSATAALLRLRDDRLDYLVLCDSPICLTHPDGTMTVIADNRAEHLPGGRPYSQRLVERSRNRPGGFWVAGTCPEAAFHALTGSVPAASVSSAALLTDGVTRLVEWYGHTWTSLIGALQDGGPDALLARVRALETAHGAPGRAKPHDDATVAYLTFQ
ncbi:protein phosphatase 2C domain-containing protein [Nonomuraea sp. NBC_01738]|uniref:protein phosphatase 2C domain-containing protein n=1 Tax=Nonomuraea sp. NBC_01738 TaxID=2976003 RepID=UPI002E147DD7|nr:protein phosphatase 2C domain-containing protein [Nonomuraea sp. NBC_01738]